MMLEVGDIPYVVGSNKEIAAKGPTPGRTPIRVPIITPMKQ